MAEKLSGSEQEAIGAAVRLECDGRAFYLEQASKAASPAARRMFESLAADEARHIEWLEALAPPVDSARTANEALYATLRKVFVEAPPSAGSEESDFEAIDTAIALEERSIAAYAEWVEKGSETVSTLGAVLVGQERFHRQLLENTREYLRTPGDWFMKEEQWNFEPG